MTYINAFDLANGDKAMLGGNRQQPQNSGQTSAGTFNFVGLLVRSWAASVEVILHKDFGEGFLGVQSVAVLLLVPIYGVFWQGYDLRPLMWFLPVYIGAVFVARLGIAKRKRNGMQIHSRYTGFPRCIKARSKWSEVQFKRVCEPVISASAGLTFCAMGEQPLGVFLIIAGVCLFLSVSISEIQFEQRAMAMNDQILEQQYVAERFRAMQGGRS